MEQQPPSPNTPQQAEIALARVNGEAVVDVPTDLFIPPDALEVFLENFEGPLDLLLYLIRRQNLDILNIPIADITRQYMQYVELMKALNLELAADYLVMAAMLAEIKSRMLLPRTKSEDEEEHLDPRAELIRRLQEYERFKKAAEDIESLPRMERDLFASQVDAPEFQRQKAHPEVDLNDIIHAFREVLQRADLSTSHHVQKEGLSVRERMSQILAMLNCESFTAFGELFSRSEGRRGVVVSFLALLELRKERLIELVQTEPYGPIHVKGV